MPTASVDQIAIRGIVACLPDDVDTLDAMALDIDPALIARISTATGVIEKRVATNRICVSDLACKAATKLLVSLNWDPITIDLLICVTQTADYLIPGVAPLLQTSLKLPITCAAFDINLGCSGYVYGLYTAASMLKTLTTESPRAILIAGDTISAFCASDDPKVRPLFGDAVTATAIEWTYDEPSKMSFLLSTDGAGTPYLQVSHGGRRNPSGKPLLFMDGIQVFSFSLREVPRQIMSLIDDTGWSISSVDYFVLHQANRQMLEAISKRLGATEHSFLINMERFGNTTSASIPLALCNGPISDLTSQRRRLIFSGFGTGWSCATAALDIPPISTLLIVNHND